MADLEYELSIGRKLAMAGITDFVKEAQRELDKLKVDPYVSSSKSKSANKSGPNDGLKMFEDEERKRQKILKDSLNQIELIEIQMGRKLIEERRKTINELKALSADPSITPEQYRRNSALMVGQYRSDLTTDAASDRDEMSRRERELRDAQHHSERLYEIHQNATYRIEQIERSSGVNLTRERQALETRIQSIIENSGGRRLSTINRIINGEIAAFNRLARSQQSGGVSGKNLQYVFQAQQAIEDFSYAGLRGAANNVALMASQLGGPAGLIALLGISATQLYSLSDAFNKSEQDTERYRATLERTRNAFLSLTEITYVSPPAIVKTQEDVDRLGKSLEDASKKHRALQDTMGNREQIAGVLTEFKKQMEIVNSRDQFGGGWGPEAIRQANERIQQLKETLKTLAPQIDWDRVLGDKSFKQVDEILSSITSKITEYLSAVVTSGKEVESMGRHWQTAVKHLERVNEFRESIGLKKNETYEPYSDAESTADKRMVRQLERDKAYWKKLAEDAIQKMDIEGFRKADEMARSAANNLDQLKAAMEAVRDAQREQLDTARDELRAAKERNAEAEQRLKHEQAISKEIENEHRRQRISNASDQLDTQQGMTNNALNKMKERDMRLVSMSPNQDWQRLMTHQIDQYYEHMQARSDRFFAQQKNQQLQANARAAAESGDHKESRSYLEQLKSHQQQQAMNARTPQEAQFWYNKSLETQKRIEESFQKQKAQQQEKIAGIRDEIKSVEDLEKRVEELSDKLRNTPKLDMTNPAVLSFLNDVDGKLQDILNKQQQMQQNAGGGGMMGGGNPFAGFGGNAPFNSTGGGNPFGGVDWGSPDFGGSNPVGTWQGGPFGGVDWDSPEFGGGAIPASGPVGGWGFGGMSAGAPVPESGMTAALAGLPSPFSNYGGQSIVNNQNVSIGNMPIQISSSFDLNSVHASARHAASNNLLRRGA